MSNIKIPKNLNLAAYGVNKSKFADLVKYGTYISGDTENVYYSARSFQHWLTISDNAIIGTYCENSSAYEIPLKRAVMDVTHFNKTLLGFITKEYSNGYFNMSCTVNIKTTKKVVLVGNLYSNHGQLICKDHSVNSFYVVVNGTSTSIRQFYNKSLLIVQTDNEEGLQLVVEAISEFEDSIGDFIPKEIFDYLIGVREAREALKNQLATKEYIINSLKPFEFSDPRVLRVHSVPNFKACVEVKRLQMIDSNGNGDRRWLGDTRLFILVDKDFKVWFASPSEHGCNSGKTHPHFFSVDEFKYIDGVQCGVRGACFGNAGEEFVNCQKQKNAAGAILVALRFLQQYNSQDNYGRRYVDYEKVDPTT